MKELDDWRIVKKDRKDGYKKLILRKRRFRNWGFEENRWGILVM